jgi:site-specific DNA-methyltransferase (adenine-specific)
MIQIENKDALQWLKEQPEYSADLIYCDPPYALGSEIIIKPDGKPDYKKAVDFMAKWEMPDGAFWEEFYKEANRVLKHGGHLLMFGIDRQLFLFGYYSNLAGFETKQSLYWYTISGFPKASDLSKMIDKNAGAEREVVGMKKLNAKDKKVYTPNVKSTFSEGKESGQEITTPTTDLAKKYDGFKYSIAPLKQVVETIMVFQKPYKTGSALHDVLAYENGDNECTVGALDIENNRVEIKDNDRESMIKKNNSFKNANNKDYNGINFVNNDRNLEVNPTGRFPSQAFVTTETAEILDKQSGVSTSKQTEINNKGTIWGSNNTDKRIAGHNDTGGASKILHKCDFETADYDLFVYEPKVSASERASGCENLEFKTSASADFRPNHTEKAENGENGNPYGRWKKLTNNHPTLKPIALNYQITKLFKTPNPQTVLVPFSGAGSELIGLFKAGFENIKGCELNPEYVEIARARVKHHCEDLFNQNILI